MAAIAGVALCLAPYVRAPERLAPMTANQVFNRARTALQHDAFSETLSYRNRLWPSSLTASGLGNLFVPNADVQTIALFQAGERHWRFEEINRTNNLVGVVARAGQRLIAYDSTSGNRMVERLKGALGRFCTVWQIPSELAWQGDWTATSAAGRFAGEPAYQVTLRPIETNTLWGRVTYWFSARNFLPLALSITDSHAQIVLSLRIDTFKLGVPAGAVVPPTAGRRIAPTAELQLLRASGRETLRDSVAFPARLGPLARRSERQALGRAVAVYGAGPGEVVALATNAEALGHHRALDVLHPLEPSGRFWGATDGLLSVVTFRHGGREIVLMGSRSPRQLARWAQNAWQ